MLVPGVWVLPYGFRFPKASASLSSFRANPHLVLTMPIPWTRAVQPTAAGGC